MNGASTAVVPSRLVLRTLAQEPNAHPYRIWRSGTTTSLPTKAQWLRTFANDTTTVHSDTAKNDATANHKRKVAIVLGVANQRSIAWSCVKALLRQNYHVIVTHQDRFHDKVQALIQTHKENNNNNNNQEEHGQILGHVNCNVQTDLPLLFSQQIPSVLDRLPNEPFTSEAATPTQDTVEIDAIVHCIAHGDLTQSLRHVSWNVYQEAQHVSAYSFLETAQCALEAAAQHQLPLASEASLTALSYLGAVRAVYPYHVMGPAKAALEALVRGMALEFGPNQHHHQDPTDTTTTTTTTRPFSPRPSYRLRVNAVSAGPIATLSARGGIAQFAHLQQIVADHSPLGRSVTADEVAHTVVHLTLNPAMTGQIVYVDGGFSSMVPINLPSS